jgi:hypothetical protein
VDIFLGEIGGKTKPARRILPPRTRFDTTRIPHERGGNKLIFFSLKKGQISG